MDSPKYLGMIMGHPKGAFMRLKVRRPLKMKKGQPQFFKEWVAVVRPGIDYDNIGEVKEKRESGELPAENAGLPYGQWFQFPYVVEHNGRFHYRFVPRKGSKVNTIYLDADGNQVDKDSALSGALASEKKSAPAIVFNVSEEHILEIQDEPVV